MMLTLGEDMKTSARITLFSLDRLLETGGKPSIEDIIQAAQVSRSTVIRNVDELEKCGYIVVRRRGGNQRNHYDITPRGRDYLSYAFV